MTVARDYGTMQNRIADELGGRGDLLSNSANMTSTPIQLAIQDAIGYYTNDRFWFNELRQASAFSTVLNQEFYTSSDWSAIPNLWHIDKLSILVGNNRYYMVGRTEQYIEDMAMSTTNNGVPIDYSYYNKRLRFYPIPNAAYPVNFLGTQQFTELSATTDTNAWMSDGEQLIRTTAEWFLLRDTIKDDVGALRMEKASMSAFSSLKGGTFTRMAALTIKPSYF